MHDLATVKTALQLKEVHVDGVQFFLSNDLFAWAMLDFMGQYLQSCRLLFAVDVFRGGTADR